MNYCIFSSIVAATKAIPPYDNRGCWINLKVSDFGDGSAFPEIHMKQYNFLFFPEIHMKQYPLDMGSKDKSNTKSQAPAKESYTLISRPLY